MLNIMMGYYKCVKCKKHGTLTCMKNLIHNVLMYQNKVWWSGLTNMRPDSCVLGINGTLLVMKDTLFVVVKSLFGGDLRYWK